MTNLIARIFSDTISSDGVRTTEFSLRYPKFIHASILTHSAIRMNATNSLSLPLWKVLEQVETNPATPICVRSLMMEEEIAAERVWNTARASAIQHARRYLELPSELHMQFGKRLLEPFILVDAYSFATDYGYGNFFDVYNHSGVDPVLNKLIGMMRREYDNTVPRPEGE